MFFKSPLLWVFFGFDFIEYGFVKNALVYLIFYNSHILYGIIRI